MSVDTVNEALTKVKLRICNNSEAFSVCARTRMHEMMGYMRCHLMQEDIEAFNHCINSWLQFEPQMSCIEVILDELFAELGFPEGTRDQLDLELAKA